MGPIVRLVGSGLGLASEAIAAHKASRAEKYRAEARGPATSASQAHPPGPATTRSREPSPNPAYSTLDASSSDYGLVEAADEEHARQLIEEGHAQPWDQPHEVGNGNAEDQDDEVYWKLDEEAAALEGSLAYEEGGKSGQEACDSSDSKDREEKPDVHKLVMKFLSAHPVSSRTPPSHPLPCPVIIPQRRPHSKSRGFIRAYAPVLEDCGIDEATFMAFLDTFQKASQVSRGQIPITLLDVLTMTGLPRLRGHLPRWPRGRLCSHDDNNHHINNHTSYCRSRNRSTKSPQNQHLPRRNQQQLFPAPRPLRIANDLQTLSNQVVLCTHKHISCDC